MNSARLKVGSLPASSVPLMNLPPFSPVALQSARTDSRPEEGDDSGGAGGTTHTVLAVHSNTMKTSSRLSSVQSRLTPDASRNVRSRSLGGGRRREGSRSAAAREEGQRREGHGREREHADHVQPKVGHEPAQRLGVVGRDVDHLGAGKREWEAGG